MCGLVYYKSFKDKNVASKVIERYQQQRSRGTSGFGFYIPETNRLAHNTSERRILRLLEGTTASEILYHHRWPTSTDNVRNACHPFSTKDYFKHNYILAHNGVIMNDGALAKSQSALGIQYVSQQKDGRFNDSEALLWDVALYLEGEKSHLDAEGDIAFIVIERDETGKQVKLHYGRNTGSPLFITMSRREMSLASEIGQMAEGHLVPANTLFSFDYETYETSEKHLNIPEWYRQVPGYETYPYAPAYTSKSPWAGGRSRVIDIEGTERKYWDTEIAKWIPQSELVYGSDSYYAMTNEKGGELAMELYGELGDVEDALSQAKDRYDSVVGKIARINEAIQNFNVNTKPHNKMNKERFGLWVELDILEEAIAALQEAAATGERYEEFENQSSEEIARIINATLEIDQLNLVGEDTARGY